MLFVKNVPNWERILRILMGIAALVMAYRSWGTSTLGLIVAAAAAMIAVSGLVGYCPMCAMVGRKLDKAS